MKLHWSPRSPFVRYVMAVAHEKNLVSRIELVRSVVAMGRPNAAVMVDNPLSKIPTLVLADGTVLADSRVIARYFDAKGEGASLFPAMDEKGAPLHTREALALGHLDLLVLWRNELNRPKAAQLPNLLSAFESKHKAVLARQEANLALWEAGALAADQLATACALSYLDFRFAFLDWRAAHPELAAWHTSIAAHAWFSATLHSDEEGAQ